MENIISHLPTEQALRQSEARTRAILETAVDAIITIDERGSIESLNPAAERLFGYPAAEVIGRNVKTLMPPPYRDEHDSYLANYLATGQKKIIGIGREVVGRRKDGTTFPMELAVSELWLGDRRMFTGIARDITQRKQAEEALRLSEERFALFMQNLPGAAWIKDVQGRYVYANAVGEKIFRRPLDELRGQTDDQIFPAEFAAQFQTNDRLVLHSGTALQTIETLLQEDGLHVSIVRKFPLLDREGTVVMVGGVAFDITDRKRAEEQLQFYTAELQERNAELLRSNQELDDFAYIASHDLKEPLRGIHNYAVFLLEDYAALLGTDGRAKLETLTRLTQRMNNLLDSLLEFSRVGRLDFAIKETDLNGLVEEVLDSLRITLQERGVEVRIPRPLPTFQCDRVRVSEVFRNLITNAMKYNDKPHKWIEIGWCPTPGPDGGQQAEQGDSSERPTVLYVRDNGIGIREKHFDAIFRIFKRLHARDQFGGGTGVGLTIIKKIIERHGGRIWVQSQHGEGTTFFFTLAGGGQKP